MRHLVVALTLALVGPVIVHADLSTKERTRVNEAAAVLTAIHAVPDKDVPKADEDDNLDLYGRDFSLRDVLTRRAVRPPVATHPFMTALKRP